MTTTTTTQPAETRLDALPPRACAVVRRIETDGDDVQRLKTLGICVGRRLEVVRTGDPLIVRIFGSRLGVVRLAGVAGLAGGLPARPLRDAGSARA